MDNNTLVRAAALNNAEWCDALSRTHGVAGEFGATAWTAPRRTPPFYPDAVTLTADADAGQILGRVDTASGGCSVKDSYAGLDLTAAGFDVLFEAQWIHRPADRSTPAAGGPLRWRRVDADDELSAWETAWDGGVTDLFRPDLLTDEAVAVLAGFNGSTIVAGAVANRSTSVVGLSNTFGNWPGALPQIAQLWPGLPLVGYESGDDLDAALGQGFEAVGPLRVWLG
ncbi:hypothetical protein [Streptomyces beijiangensis]|uniref:Uncharacterized protein n=1 Tax=Streptomyces beijiangensis TaxID=163361 RepID=A0A939F561_9ACTN|nr:hypothetical protein [Streptomyces beijiangensis]MBO0512766.1 hypothetical protein [Streptomyces beijiangensis]